VARIFLIVGFVIVVYVNACYFVECDYELPIDYRTLAFACILVYVLIVIPLYWRAVRARRNKVLDSKTSSEYPLE